MIIEIVTVTKKLDIAVIQNFALLYTPEKK